MNDEREEPSIRYIKLSPEEAARDRERRARENEAITQNRLREAEAEKNRIPESIPRIFEEPNFMAITNELNALKRLPEIGPNHILFAIEGSNAYDVKTLIDIFKKAEEKAKELSIIRLRAGIPSKRLTYEELTELDKFLAKSLGITRSPLPENFVFSGPERPGFRNFIISCIRQYIEDHGQDTQLFRAE